jgi:glycosidase
MNKKIVIYQVFTRLFGNRNNTCKCNGTVAENGCGKMSFFSEKILKQIKAKGMTHIWYTGVIRHASATDYSSFGIPTQHPAVVKGKAGSPYAITDYYDIDPDIADKVPDRMKEFEALIRRTHRCGLGFIMDFVPNHVARQYRSIAKPDGVKDLGEDDDKEMGFSADNNFYYCVNTPFEPEFDVCYEGRRYEEFPAKATGNDRFDNHPGRNDWYETVKLNYGVDYCDAGGRSYHFDPIPDTWNKMTDILLYWASKGIDGFRCDMAEMVPAEFWRWAIGIVKAEYPKILFIAEVYNPAEYRNYISSGFDYLYDKVGMYDTMRAVIRGEAPTVAISNAWQSVDDINGHMLYFLENHDEQRIASDFFAGNAFKAIPAVMVNALMRQNPFMLYAGQEYGERGMDHEGFSGCDGRTTIFDYWTVKSLYKGYQHSVELTDDERNLNATYTKILNLALHEKAVGRGEFFDLMYVNQSLTRQYAFIRKYKNEVLIVIVNFSDEDVKVSVNIPEHAFDYLGIDKKKYSVTELLNDRKLELDFSEQQKITDTIDAYRGNAYKFTI